MSVSPTPIPDAGKTLLGQAPRSAVLDVAESTGDLAVAAGATTSRRDVVCDGPLPWGPGSLDAELPAATPDPARSRWPAHGADMQTLRANNQRFAYLFTTAAPTASAPRIVPAEAWAQLEAMRSLHRPGGQGDWHDQRIVQEWAEAALQAVFGPLDAWLASLRPHPLDWPHPAEFRRQWELPDGAGDAAGSPPAPRGSARAGLADRPRAVAAGAYGRHEREIAHDGIAGDVA